LSYRKAIVVGAGVGLLLAIALATIDRIMVARLDGVRARLRLPRSRGSCDGTANDRVSDDPYAPE
jgi:hypothetical protein